MKNNIFGKIVLFCSFLSLTNCASLGGKYDKEKVGKIRSIAIVGFTYDAPLETSGHIMSALMGNEKKFGSGGPLDSKMDRTEGESATAKKVYDEVVANLSKAGWKVKSAEEVQASPAVKAFYAKSVKIGMLPLQSGDGRYERAGIPQYHHVASLAGKGEFAKMAKDLRVDGVAVVYVASKGSQTIPMVSKISHFATTSIQIFDPISDDLIMLSSSNGKEIGGNTKTKIGKDFLADVEKGALASIDQFGQDFRNRLKNN